MDNKNCKNKSVAKIMLTYLDRIKELLSQHAVPRSQLKADQSPVTALDLALSGLIEEVTRIHFPEAVFYSEENFSKWAFPMLVLDPLDGTREYIEGVPEWAISIGLFKDDTLNGEGWVFNPNTGELYTQGKAERFKSMATYTGEVSRWEWKSGLFNKYQGHPKFKLAAKGSIAYKLGRLSAGKSDFVVSLKPKNIWDIAGGTLLCQQAGINFYSGGKLVTKVEKTYEPPLIWCREELFSELSGTFV